MRRFLGVSIVGLAIVSGCATAPTSIDFSASKLDGTKNNLDASGAGDAILIVAIGAVGTGGGYQFRQVDAGDDGFAADPITLGFGSWGVGDKMQRPADQKSSIWVLRDEINFLIKRVPAGRYAATQASWNTFNGVSSGSAWLCQDEGAVVFDIAASSINLISSKDAFPPGIVTRISAAHDIDAVLKQFELTRANYPDLLGEPIVQLPTSVVSWAPKTDFFSDSCNSIQDGSMVVTPVHLATDTSAPDAAEQAAIAAALANIEKQENETPAEPMNAQLPVVNYDPAIQPRLSDQDEK